MISIFSFSVLVFLYYSVWNIMFASIYLRAKDWTDFKLAFVFTNTLGTIFPVWIYFFNIQEETILTAFTQGEGYKLFF